MERGAEQCVQARAVEREVHSNDFSLTRCKRPQSSLNHAQLAHFSDADLQGEQLVDDERSEITEAALTAFVKA